MGQEGGRCTEGEKGPSPLEDGVKSGHFHWAAGRVRCMRGESPHFPGQSHSGTILPPCPGTFSKDLRGLAYPGLALHNVALNYS